MLVRTKTDFRLLGVVGIAKFFVKGVYKATPATNQPEWKEKGKVFISNGLETLLIESKDYDELAEKETGV